jgi:hypothetical protein
VVAGGTPLPHNINALGQMPVSWLGATTAGKVSVARACARDVTRTGTYNSGTRLILRV